MSDPRGPEAFARIALLVSPHSPERDATTDHLTAAGYRTIVAATWQEAEALKAEHLIAVILLDDRITRESCETRSRESIRLPSRDRSPREEVPLLLLVDLVDPGHYPGLDSLTASDWIAKPIKATELVRRLDELVAKTERERARRMNARTMRDSVRAISAAIRSTNEPQSMATALVTGLGQAFDAPSVWFAAFQDHGAADITVGVQQERRDLGIRDDQAEALATRLWASGSILTVMDDPSNLPDGAERWLTGWATQHGLAAFAAVPVGDLDSVLGIILIGDVRRAREWTSLDTSLISHVAQNLAHGLRQARLIAAQEHVLARMAELDRAKTDLMATVNHELRTPLTSIVGYLGLVQDGDGGEIPDEAAEMLQVVGRNARRLQGLVDDMLTMSRLEAEVAPSIMVPIELRPLLDRVVESIHPLAASRGVTLAVDGGSFRPLVVGEETQLERAFTNLVQNSVKFTPAEGTVRVRLDRGADGEANSVVVRVSDTGIGIPPDDLPRLFTRFFRASNATAAVIPGTGLGLAIVQSLIEAHHGQVEVQSTVDVGTTFAVHLPLAASMVGAGTG